MYQGANIGIPYNVVSGTQPKVNVIVDAYADESDLLPVPIPTGAVIEGDPLPSAQNTGDRHLLVYDKDNNIAYELFNVHRPSETADGQWHADSEAVWNMAQDSFRTPGYTSADAAGLPILPGLVRVDEVLDQGMINHALRFTVPRSDSEYVFPASHQAGVNNTSYPRMGERFRLKASFDISGFSPANQVILQALKTYGMIVADNGSSWYLSGAPSSRWNDDELHALSSIVGSNFEAVDLRPRLTSLDQTSGSTAGGTAVTIHGQNFSGAAGQLQVRFGTTPATNVTIVSDTVLIATSPAHAAGQVDVTVQTPYGTSATSTADRYTYQTASGRPSARLFYKGSAAWDITKNNLPGFSDDNAIAADKTAYVPGSGSATFANVSSYTRGINGLMVDLPTGHGTIRANDFVFKVGNNNSPSLWTTAPPPSLVTTRVGAGTGGSDRIELMWPDNAIQKEWLEVIVRGNDALGGSNSNTGLSSSYVFFFGSAVGDSGAGDSTTFVVNSTDEISARNDPHSTLSNPAPITNVNDYNRDGNVNSTDQIASRNIGTSSLSTALNFLTVGSGGPFAPAVSKQDDVIAAALSLPASAIDGDAIATALSAQVADGSTSNVVAASGWLPPSQQDSARATYFERLAQDWQWSSEPELALDFDDRIEPENLAACPWLDAGD